MMEENLKRIVSIVKDRDITAYTGKEYFYPNIPDKIFEQIYKNFDPNANANAVAAFFDTSLTGRGKSGLIFTLYGLYYHTALYKPQYIRYCDIKSIHVTPNKKGYVNKSGAIVNIYLTNNTQIDIEFEICADNLANVLEELKAHAEEFGNAGSRETAEIRKVKLSREEKRRCHKIIHSHALLAGGKAVLPDSYIPGSDSAIITTIQAEMTIELAKVFGIRLTEAAAKGLLGSYIAALLGREAAKQLWQYIPIIGQVINLTTAGGITEAAGWMIVRHFKDAQNSDAAKYKLEGEKAGYADASEEYKDKLAKQAALFLNQITDFEKERDSYEELLKEYESYIEELEMETLPSMKKTYNALVELDNLKK